MTHDELVRRACHWLWHTKRCKPVFAEFQHLYSGEMPDAIGWTPDLVHVVEVKVSRADFVRDKKKWHKRTEGSMGHRRWYLVPKGLVGVEHVPVDHGLLYATAKTIRVVKKAPPRTPTARATREAEIITRIALCRYQDGVEWRSADYRFAPLKDTKK